MFGGAGIYRDGIMFALVADNEVFLKADDVASERFREAGCRPFAYAKDGKPVDMSYWSVPDAALDDPDALKTWAELAFEAAVRSRKARPAKRR
jgi:DNA transformation protein and related proteins